MQLQRYFLFFILLVLGTRLWAQNQVSFVVTSATDEVLEYTEVLVSKTKSFQGVDVIAYAVAGESGIASVKLNNGVYYAKFVAVGHQDQIEEVRVTGAARFPIVMSPLDERLGQTVITIQSRPISSTKAVEKILVVSKKELDARSVFNLRDALNQQMNVQISNDNSTGSSVSLMGVTGQNVKILIDGVPVIGRLDGNIDLSQININDIERIEVVEGPVSTAYGSNALAGVINIITKKKTSTKGEITVDGYHESNGQDNFSVVAGKQLKKYNLRVGGSRNFFAGWDPVGDTRYDWWKPKEQYNGRAQLSRKGKKFDLLFKTEIFTELLINKGKPLPSYFETAFDEEFRTRRTDYKVQFNRHADSNRTFNGFIAYNTYNRLRNKFFVDLTTLDRQNVNDGGEDTTGFTALMSRGTYNLTGKQKKHTWQLGYDIISQSGTGVRIADGGETISDFAVFATTELSIGKKLILKPGLRAAYNTVYKAPLAPTISARYKHKDYIYRFSYGRGFRAPDLKELYLNFVDVNHNVVGNPNLQAETSHNVQFSTTGFHKAKRGLLIRPFVSVFYNNIFDKITLANIRGQEYSYVNLDHFVSAGGNVRLGIAGKKTKVNLGFSSTHVTTWSDLDEDAVSSFGYLEWNANYSRSFGKVTFNAFVKHNGAKNIFRLDAETNELIESRIDAFTLMDVQLGRPFLKKRLVVNVGGKNIFNVTNVNNVVVQSDGVHTAPNQLAMGTGRSYFIKAIYKLAK